MNTFPHIADWMAQHPYVAEWVVALASVFGLVSIIILWKQLGIFNQQLKSLNSQLKAEHEKCRRELAVDLMRFWCSNRSFHEIYFIYGRKMVEEFSKSQCQQLIARERVVVDEKFRHFLDGFRADLSRKFKFPKSDGQSPSKDTLELSKVEMTCLMGIVNSYMNHLETIATAWRHNVADRAIIEEEFQKIVSLDKKDFVLEIYRRETGVFPSIQEFTRELIHKQSIRESKGPIA